MISVDFKEGLILLYGAYPLFSLKPAVFCLISGIIGGLMVFFDAKAKNKIKGFLLRFIIGVILGFIAFGLIRDYWNIEPKEYIAGIVGFLSFPAFNWVFNNLDPMVDALFK